MTHADRFGHGITRGRSTAPDDGMVTAELAVALPALILVLLAAVYAVSAVGAQLRCADAAGVAARLAARGEAMGDVQATALRAAPSGSRLAVRSDGDLVWATVTERLEPPVIGSLLPAVTLRSSVAAAVEPSGAGRVSGGG